jgi:hypothetical protein
VGGLVISNAPCSGYAHGARSGKYGEQIDGRRLPEEFVYPGVDITLKNAFSDDEYQTVSDSTGAFFIGDVPDGIYVLTIAGGMNSITGAADITKQVLDLVHAQPGIRWHCN